MAYTVQQIIAALKLYDKIKKVVPTVRQLGYPAAHTLYEWINQRKATNGKFPNLMPSGVKSINLKVKMDHDGYSAERKLQILKRCFEGTENIQSHGNKNESNAYADRKQKHGVYGIHNRKRLSAETYRMV